MTFLSLCSSFPSALITEAFWRVVFDFIMPAHMSQIDVTRYLQCNIHPPVGLDIDAHDANT